MSAKTKILILDDDEDIGKVLKLMLEYRGYAVNVLDRDEKTEETLRNNNIDLIILDMLIAGVNGTDVCSRLKKDETLAHLPIIMISALPDAEEDCLKAGASHFISKPFEMKDMLATINNLTTRPMV